WQVLYTKQITQKAKKFRDGVLRLASCGSSGRQGIIRYDMFAWVVGSHVVRPFSTTNGIMIMLYDATRTLLDSGFLKMDEIIISGESLAFDAHLVDIGEIECDHKSPMDLKAPEKKLQEWEAMYSSHITQKNKKYHDGILGLSLCGSYQKQQHYQAIHDLHGVTPLKLQGIDIKVTLLTEDGTVLSHKFLKLSEDVTTGSALKLSNYLVEVGEPRRSHKGKVLL
ncbi:unnamed protein product, partial [Ilex paraguariensis]